MIAPLPGKRGANSTSLGVCVWRESHGAFCRAPQAFQCLQLAIRNHFHFLDQKPEVASAINFKTFGDLGRPAKAPWGSSHTTHTRGWCWLQVSRNPPFFPGSGTIHGKVWLLLPSPAKIYFGSQTPWRLLNASKLCWIQRRAASYQPRCSSTV